MTSEIDKLKHFHVEDYSGIYFTDELNNGEEFLYTTIGIKDDKEVTFLCKYVNLGLSKKLWKNILKLVINIELIQVKLLLVIILIYLVI